VALVELSDQGTASAPAAEAGPGLRVGHVVGQAGAGRFDHPICEAADRAVVVGIGGRGIVGVARRRGWGGVGRVDGVVFGGGCHGQAGRPRHEHEGDGDGQIVVRHLRAPLEGGSGPGGGQGTMGGTQTRDPQSQRDLDHGLLVRLVGLHRTQAGSGLGHAGGRQLGVSRGDWRTRLPAPLPAKPSPRGDHPRLECELHPGPLGQELGRASFVWPALIHQEGGDSSRFGFEAGLSRCDAARVEGLGEQRCDSRLHSLGHRHDHEASVGFGEQPGARGAAAGRQRRDHVGLGGQSGRVDVGGHLADRHALRQPVPQGRKPRVEMRPGANPKHGPAHANRVDEQDPERLKIELCVRLVRDRAAGGHDVGSTSSIARSTRVVEPVSSRGSRRKRCRSASGATCRRC
jgi:hypothetical protein